MLRPTGPDRPLRLAVLGLLPWLGLWGWARSVPSGISWHWFDGGAALLVGSGPGHGLQLYAAHPDLQIGPVAFAVTAVLDRIAGPLPGSTLGWAQVLMTAALPACLWLLRAPGGSPRADRRLVVLAFVLAPTWTVLAVRWAHLDDVLAMVLLCVLVRAVRQDRAVLAGAALGLAAGAKPWAVVGAALLAVLPLRRAARGVVAGAVVLAGIWLPFLLAAPGTLAAFRPPVPVSDSSLLALAGYGGDWMPGWVRTAQLLLAPAVALLLVRSGRWPAALLAGLGTRLLLDPQDLGYYAGSAALAAAVLDLLGSPAGRRRWFPVATVLTTVLLWQPFVADYDARFRTSRGLARAWFEHPHLVAVVHLLAALAGAAVLLARSRSGGSAPPCRPRRIRDRSSTRVTRRAPAVSGFSRSPVAGRLALRGRGSILVTAGPVRGERSRARGVLPGDRDAVMGDAGVPGPTGLGHAGVLPPA